MSVMAAPANAESLLVPSAGDEGFLFELVDDDDEELGMISIDCLRSTSTKHLNPLYINNIDMIINSPRRSMASDKEISVDPISVKQSVPVVKTVMPGGGAGRGDIALHRSNSSMKKPPVAVSVTRKDSSNFKYPPPVPPPASTAKSNKFLSCSLPSSATSSPLCGPLSKNSKKWRNLNHAPAPPLPPAISYLARQRSAAVSPFSAKKESDSYLARSKSCGEGRASAPSDEFDILSRKLGDRKNDQQLHDEDDEAMSTAVDCEELEDYERTSRTTSKDARKSYDDNFKCGALSCLYLPGFGKGKPVRPPRRQEEEEEEERGGEEKRMTSRNVVISRTVSLEKFECGSWSSSAIMNEDRDDGDTSHFYDLPLELIRSSANDTDTPVATAFVFEREIKGVLKNSSSRRDQPRDSHESSKRHVRFSTSDPPSSCITPRLRKAREDFNAFLEAQV